MLNKIGLIPNLQRDSDLTVTRELAAFIHQNGCTAYIEQALYQQTAVAHTSPSADIYADVDFLVVLGGDGTILNAAKQAAINNTPLIGINLGNLGYLTDVEKSESKAALANVLTGHYKSERRMMIETAVSSGETLPLALNDVCISRSTSAKLISLNIYVNGEYIDCFRADGIIISTPTGSTAYNLSAGGPILKPDAEMIAITPICPHTLYARPFVVSSEDVIAVKPNYSPYGNAIVAMDGQDVAEVSDRDSITIRKSKNYTTILRTTALGFYDILRLKMMGEVKNENKKTRQDC